MYTETPHHTAHTAQGPARAYSKQAPGWPLTHVVLNVADIEGGGRDRQAQPVFLGHEDGLSEAVLLHVAQRELAAGHTHHHVFRAAGKVGVRGHAGQGPGPAALGQAG